MQALPFSFAKRHSVVFATTESGLNLSTSLRSSWIQIENLRRLHGSDLEVVMLGEEELQELVAKTYSEQSDRTVSIVESLERSDGIDDLVTAVSEKEDLLDGDGQSPVIQLVNSLIFETVKADASDLHIQPYEDRLAVRIRVDGILFDCHELPKRIQDEVVSRIKVQGKMNIAEKRLPQDGRATVRVGDRVIDLRIASLPSNYGERVVIRLLDKSAKIYNLSEIGMNTDTHSVFDDLVHLEPA